MPEDRSADPLTRALRAADPAAGDPGLDRSERARMRQRILDAGSEAHRRPAGWLLPAAAAMTLLALTLGLALRQPAPPMRPPLAAGPETELAAGAGRQIQFTTDNGTLVVWVLQPKPRQPTNLPRSPRP